MRLDPDEKMILGEKNSIFLNSLLTLPKTIIEIPRKFYVDYKFNDPSIMKNSAHVDFNEQDLDNVRLVKINSMLLVGEHLTAKYYVDNDLFYSVNESSLLGLNPDEKRKLDERNSIILSSTLTSPKTMIEIPTKSYVHSLHEINRNRRELSSVYNDQDNIFDNNKLTNSDSVVFNRNPNSDNELANKKHVDDSRGEGNVPIFNQTLQNYLKVSVGNDTYSLTKSDEKQITDTLIIKYPNTGGHLLWQWYIKCNDKNIKGKIQNFIKSTKTNNPTSYSGAANLPPISDSLMNIESSSKNHGNNVFVGFERTDNIQFSNKTSY